MKYIDEDLGVPIPERDYGGNCRIYDHEMPSDPYHNLKNKVDVFVFAHLFGYFCKTLIFRWVLSSFISIQIIF